VNSRNSSCLNSVWWSMTTAETQKPLRLWPGVAIVVLQWLGRFGVPAIVPDWKLFGLLGGIVFWLALLVWWAVFSRAPRAERFGAIGVIAASIGLLYVIADVSMRTGAQGLLLILLATPLVSLAFLIWIIASRRLGSTARWVTMAGTLFAASGVWALVKTGGFSSDFNNELMWRWAKSPEERLLAVEPVAPVALPEPVKPVTPVPSVEKPAEVAAVPEVPKVRAQWPGFRGGARDSIVLGVQIKTDWAAAPPVEMWRRPIGPGWSSFAVDGDLLYTQEQRGEHEVVGCYSVTTGKTVWQHTDAARFWESNAGAGPRGTPALDKGRVYTLGGTGIVNALNGRNGTVIWTRDAVADTGAKLPTWGFSGSPLVLEDAVIVAASGKLISYDLETGKPRWVGPAGGASYSSPHLATIDGVRQIVLVSAVGATGIDPADGAQLWRHEWKGYPIVQPAITEDGDVLVSINESSGTRRLNVSHGQSGWNVEERWTSNGLKPYFNDFVIHKGHAYGFDGRILACIDLADGKRKWKGGRFGQGQLILLPEQDLLLVLSEEGELGLVNANPDSFTEVARRPAITGKTWNHPVLTGGVLLVRNGEEMAAFRLALH